MYEKRGKNEAEQQRHRSIDQTEQRPEHQTAKVQYASVLGGSTFERWRYFVSLWPIHVSCYIASSVRSTAVLLISIAVRISGRRCRASGHQRAGYGSAVDS